MSVGAICFTSSGSNGGCWVVLVFPRLFLFWKKGFFPPHTRLTQKKSLRKLNKLFTSLLAAWHLLVQNTAPPQHVYSHLAGTFLVRLMDAVDSLAREEGLNQVPRHSWIPELRQLPVLFTHYGGQVQGV